MLRRGGWGKCSNREGARASARRGEVPTNTLANGQNGPCDTTKTKHTTNITPRTNNFLPRPNDRCRQMAYHIFVLLLDWVVLAIVETLKQLNCMPRESSVSAWRCETNKHTSSSHVIHETLISILYTPSCRQQFGGMDPLYSYRRSSKALFVHSFVCSFVWDRERERER